MVPGLRRVVEHPSIALSMGAAGDVDQRHAVIVGALDGVVQLVDVALVVLAVMEAEGPFRHMRRQGVLGIGKIGKLESHYRFLRVHGGGKCAGRRWDQPADAAAPAGKRLR
ncbi:MAG TPA: hypothetical protein DIW51_03720 [Rhodospirillaceae bacterium]|nr:hypothetical protein [Rhodospirillaceae bacterium]